MGKIFDSYSLNSKKLFVKYYIDGIMTKKEILDKYGMSKTSLNNWIKKYKGKKVEDDKLLK